MRFISAPTRRMQIIYFAQLIQPTSSEFTEQPRIGVMYCPSKSLVSNRECIEKSIRKVNEQLDCPLASEDVNDPNETS